MLTKTFSYVLLILILFIQRLTSLALFISGPSVGGIEHDNARMVHLERLHVKHGSFGKEYTKKQKIQGSSKHQEFM